MGLERRTDAKTIYLAAKHYCLWQEFKKPVDGCETIDVNNPKTGAKVTKYGFGYNTVNARVTKIVWYDTKKQYATRYIGFKLHMEDGPDRFVLDLPYSSQALRRFLVIAPNVNWALPLSITVFKGKKKGEGAGADPLVVWFRQEGETVKAYFTKDEPHGCPQAIHDERTDEWDFREQRRWLATYLQEQIVPVVESVAKLMAQKQAPPIEPVREPVTAGDDHQEDETPEYDPYAGMGITDDDVPF